MSAVLDEARGDPAVIGAWPRRAWTTAASAMRIFLRIEGTQRAGAFAYFAFFSLFAAVILCVAVASIFFERDRAASEVIAFIESYIPIGASAREHVFQTIESIANGRGPASLFAFALLGWSVMRFIATLLRAVNRAWSTDLPPWWRLSLKSLAFLLVVIAAVPLGMAFPILLRPLQEWLLPQWSLPDWAYSFGSFALRFSVLFLALSVFYKLGPRRYTRFSEVWLASAAATLLLIGAETLFAFYLGNIASLNAVYGAFGAVVALLMWVYLSGSIFIYGACLCAARAELRESGGYHQTSNGDNMNKRVRKPARTTAEPDTVRPEPGEQSGSTGRDPGPPTDNPGENGKPGTGANTGQGNYGQSGYGQGGYGKGGSNAAPNYQKDEPGRDDTRSKESNRGSGQPDVADAEAEKTQSQ